MIKNLVFFWAVLKPDSPNTGPEPSEVNVVVRSFSLGAVLVLSALAAIGLSSMSAVQAAYPGWSSHAGQQRNPQFRPWSRTDARPAAMQRRVQMRAPATRRSDQTSRRATSLSTGHQWRQQPDFGGQRAGARKAVPITRGQELGLRFRPDERASPYGQSVLPQGDGASAVQSEQLQSQFRPTRPKRKPTYEELEAERAAVQPQQIGPAMPYPMLPQPLPMYPGRAPLW